MPGLLGSQQLRSQDTPLLWASRDFSPFTLWNNQQWGAAVSLLTTVALFKRMDYKMLSSWILSNTFGYAEHEDSQSSIKFLLKIK